MTTARRRTAFLVVTAAGIMLALPGGTPRRVPDGAERSSVVASASLRWPSYTLRDWVDFADQVSVLRVTSAARMEPAEGVRETGEGYVGRKVSARIEETLWRDPASPPLGDEVSFRTWGWAVHDERFVPMLDESSVWLEPGDRVVAPLLRTPEGDWGPLAPSAVLRIVGSRTAFSAGQKRAYPDLSSALEGATPAAVAAALASTEPSRGRAYLRSLDADTRAQVLASR